MVSELKSLQTPYYYRYQDDPANEYFLGKLIKKITNAVTKPTLNKVNDSLAKAGSTSLQASATKVQQGIVEDSPKGAVKSLVIAGTVVTAGLLAPAAGAGGLTATKILDGASMVIPLLKGKNESESTFYDASSQPATTLEADSQEQKKRLILIGSTIAVCIIAVITIVLWKK